MVAFELRSVTGGWDTAALGPADQVEFAVYNAIDDPDHDSVPDEAPVVHTFASVQQLLRLYDCAEHERSTHPQFLGYEISDTAATGDRNGGIRLDLRTATIETTYPALTATLESFLGDVFDALDAHPSHGTRDEHLDTLREHDVSLVDVTALYNDLARTDDTE